MIGEMFGLLEQTVDFLWAYVGFPVVIFLGLYLSLRSRFVQLRRFPDIFRNFVAAFSKSHASSTNLHPIRAFFASIGGSLGIGNVVGVTAAVQIGGPGTLVWIWMTAIIGSLIKYSEVYIGMKYRRVLPDGSHRGGPMYFIQDAFKNSWLPTLFCLLLGVYGVEVYQFGIVASTTSYALGVSKWMTAFAFLAIIILIERGGFKRIGAISSFLIPVLVAVYVTMGAYVLMCNISLLPTVFADIFHSAFTVRAAEGGFLGSTVMLALSLGVQRGCYSTDMGVGYASIIHSASSSTTPERQASLLIFEVLMDTFFVCSLSILLVLSTGTWKENLDSSLLVQEALGKYFPYMNIFMPFFLSLLGYSVIITYFTAGMHTVRFMLPKWGQRLYYVYAIVAFLTFSFVDNRQAIVVMSFVQFFLLVLNASAIWKLRRDISFDVRQKAPALETEVVS